jgi:hypothetical protein
MITSAPETVKASITTWETIRGKNLPTLRIPRRKVMTPDIRVHIKTWLTPSEAVTVLMTKERIEVGPTMSTWEDANKQYMIGQITAE